MHAGVVERMADFRTDSRSRRARRSGGYAAARAVLPAAELPRRRARRRQKPAPTRKPESRLRNGTRRPPAAVNSTTLLGVEGASGSPPRAPRAPAAPRVPWPHSPPPAPTCFPDHGGRLHANVLLRSGRCGRRQAHIEPFPLHRKGCNGPHCLQSARADDAAVAERTPGDAKAMVDGTFRHVTCCRAGDIHATTSCARRLAASGPLYAAVGRRRTRVR